MSEKINETINNEEEVSLGLNPGAPSEQSGGMGLDPSGDLLEELRQEMNGEELGLEPGEKSEPEIPFRHPGNYDENENGGAFQDDRIRRDNPDNDRKMNSASSSSTDKNSKSPVITLTRRMLVFFCLTALAAGCLLTLGGLKIFLSTDSGGRIVSSKTLKYYKELDENWGKYYQIQKTIDQSGLYKTDRKKLDKAVAESIISSSPDPYAQYMTKDEYDSFSRKYIDSYTGIGISVEEGEGGHPQVGRVIEGGTAEEQGLKSGDKILTVDGHRVSSVKEASARLRGKAGTSVDLVVNRGGSQLKFRVARAEVQDKALEYRIYDKSSGTGYIHMMTFREGTSEELDRAIKDLKDQDCKKVIIDLRGNPGGIAREGIKCADLLLPACRIITVKKLSGKEKIYNSDSSNEQISYVLLTDGETASAAEILACAVKDNKGGKIIGSKTYGKGLIQGIYPQKDGSVLKITTEEYISPSGEKINGKGIEPDISASGDPVAQGAGILNGAQ